MVTNLFSSTTQGATYHQREGLGKQGKYDEEIRSDPPHVELGHGKTCSKRAVGLKGGPWWPPQPHGCFVQANGSVKYQFEVRLLYTHHELYNPNANVLHIYIIYIYCIYIYIVYIGKVQRCTFCILHPDPQAEIQRSKEPVCGLIALTSFSPAPARWCWDKWRPIKQSTLWLCQHSYWKWQFIVDSHGFTHWKWWFSIVTLVYQRV